jgi:hypothetical protein
MTALVIVLVIQGVVYAYAVHAALTAAGAQ